LNDDARNSEKARHRARLSDADASSVHSVM